MKSHRLRVSRIVLLFLGALVVIGGLEYHRWQRQATELFERHINELAARSPRDSSTITRPALITPSRDGDAWECYASVLRLSRAFPGKWSWPIPPAEEHDRLLALSRPLVEGIHEALSREMFTFPHHSELEARAECDELLAVIHLTLGILLRIAEGYHARGMDHEALATLGLILGMSMDWRLDTGSGITAALWSQTVELRAMDSWRRILAEHALTASELKEAAAQIDRMCSSRSPLHMNVTAHGILWRHRLVDWEKEGRGDFPYGESPSWRSAFSARLGRASALSRIESVWKRLGGLVRLPSHQWVKALETISEQEGSEGVEKPLDDIRQAYKGEVESMRGGILLRVAMAIARYEAQRGALPKSLEDVSPHYLKTVPLCPHGGEPLDYKVGSVWCVENPNDKWRVNRRE